MYHQTVIFWKLYSFLWPSLCVPRFCYFFGCYYYFVQMCMYQTTAASSAIFDLFWECAWVSKDDRWLDATEILLPFSIQILVSNGRPRVPQALPRVPLGRLLSTEDSQFSQPSLAHSRTNVGQWRLCPSNLSRLEILKSEIRLTVFDLIDPLCCPHLSVT